MKRFRVILLVAISLAFLQEVSGQGFVNLDFEDTSITPVLMNYYSGYYDYIATVPGWTWTPQFNSAAVNPYTTVSLNDIALDSPAVTLHSAADPYGLQTIEGNYSIFLQGGSPILPSSSYSAIWQTGQIPLTAQSLIYWGGAFQIAFNEQILAPFAIGNGSKYTIWAADISAFAGQSGQLRFTCSWKNSGFLDNIQFSSTTVPEPDTFALTALGATLLGFRRWQNSSR